MAALVPASWVGPLLRCLPAPLLRKLDAWSHRRAVRLQARRQEAWIRRRAAGRA